MNNLSHMQCTICGTQYRIDELQYTCPACGPLGTLDMVYDLDRLRTDWTRQRLATSAQGSRFENTMWRYEPLLPIGNAAHIPPLATGWTPLMAASRLAEDLHLRAVWTKDEGRNPTASLKDRASTMVVAHANEIGVDVISTASTGNAAAALACACASVGKQAVIFVPASAPEAKITQMLVYGAVVLLVEGSYDQAFDLCVEICAEYGWYCRNTGMNPYTTEGKKTAAYEIAEQLGWQAPDAVMVSVGDGSIIGAQYKGFSELVALGWLDKMPRLIGVQAAGSSALARAWLAGYTAAQIVHSEVQTVADSISAAYPRDSGKALRAVRNSDGAFVIVPDDAILAAISELAQKTGVFAEPAAAATLAGLRQAQREGLIGADDRVVLLVTGSGLKDIRAAMSSIEGKTSEEIRGTTGTVGTISAARQVAASIPAIRQLIKELGLA